MAKSPPLHQQMVLGQKAAKRLARSVKRTEGLPQDANGGKYARGAGYWHSIQPAKVTTIIPTGTLATPSTIGRVTIYRDDDAGHLVAAETDQICMNYHTLAAPVPINTTVSVYPRAGVWWLVNSDCY